MKKDIYKDGYNAALEGKKHWENPYTLTTSVIRNFGEWYAGWCEGMKIINDKT